MEHVDLWGGGASGTRGKTRKGTILLSYHARKYASNFVLSEVWFVGETDERRLEVVSTPC